MARASSLRPRMLTLSHSFTTSSALSSAAQPILERLSAMHQESFSVATLDGDDIVYVARTSVSRVMSVDLHIGSRLPAYCTSMGRVLLAYLPLDQVEQYLGRVEMVAHTPRTITSAEKLRMLLRTVRRNGYALCDQEFEAGLRSLAVPVHCTIGACRRNTQPLRLGTAAIHARDAIALSSDPSLGRQRAECVSALVVAMQGASRSHANRLPSRAYCLLLVGLPLLAIPAMIALGRSDFFSAPWRQCLGSGERQYFQHARQAVRRAGLWRFHRDDRH